MDILYGMRVRDPISRRLTDNDRMRSLLAVRSEVGILLVHPYFLALIDSRLAGPACCFAFVIPISPCRSSIIHPTDFPHTTANEQPDIST